MSNKIFPTILIVLDGWGYREDPEYNAIVKANTPCWDKLWQENHKTLLTCSGLEVGLPQGQMGNSEVGHITIGSGRVVYQDYTKINLSIEDQSFFSNPIFNDALQKAKKTNKSLHVMGMLSPGGVHSHQDHIFSLLKLAKKHNLEKVYIHAFLDGRDTPPRSAYSSIKKLEDLLSKLGMGEIASISGRYYSMDRDRRFERTQKSYEAITEGKAEFRANSAIAALEDAYNRGEDDEFVKPTIIGNINENKTNYILDGDIVVYMNFRADRARQLSYALYDPNFSGFVRNKIRKLGEFVTLTKYASDLNTKVAFLQQDVKNTLGEILQNNHLEQMRLAETEKYAHVTFFFNGGKDITYKGEDRILIPSPKVATYDLKPQMSAVEVTKNLCDVILKNKYHFILCNYANADMVGHTGNFTAAVCAIETLDNCLAKVLNTAKEIGADVIITADHGNAEKMYDKTKNQAHTAHTSDPVPCVYVGNKKVKSILKGASLKDIAPTILELIGIEKPKEMTGNSIFSFS